MCQYSYYSIALVVLLLFASGDAVANSRNAPSHDAASKLMRRATKGTVDGEVSTEPVLRNAGATLSEEEVQELVTAAGQSVAAGNAINDILKEHASHPTPAPTAKHVVRHPTPAPKAAPKSTSGRFGDAFGKGKQMGNRKSAKACNECWSATADTDCGLYKFGQRCSALGEASGCCTCPTNCDTSKSGPVHENDVATTSGWFKSDTDTPESPSTQVAVGDVASTSGVFLR